MDGECASGLCAEVDCEPVPCLSEEEFEIPWEDKR